MVALLALYPSVLLLEMLRAAFSSFLTKTQSPETDVLNPPIMT
jgi:hypothetical protein